MGKIIFCVVITGLCFGQDIWLKKNPEITLPVPRLSGGTKWLQ